MPIDLSLLSNSEPLCGQCNQAIVDTECDSIQCDMCSKWVHAWRECSKLKKTLFKTLKKNDTWVCPNCLENGKRSLEEIAKLKEELKETRDLNFFLFTENKALIQKVSSLESENAEFQNRPRPNLLSPAVTTNLAKEACEPSSNFKSGPILNKVHLIGDSHVRGLRALVKLSNEDTVGLCNLDVTADFYPGAPMHVFSDKLKNSETVNILVGGVNDTSIESVNKSIECLEKSSRTGKPERMVIVETPYRYDCVNFNKDIKAQNIRLKELCCKLGWHFVHVNHALFRMHYTGHGLHLNRKGKILLGKLIANDLLNNVLSGPKPFL